MLVTETLPTTSEATPGATAESKPGLEPEQPRIYRGLCMNCDLRETCALPRPESGVWFCEEYQ